MALSLRKIEVLAVLAREEGVSAAARKLGLTQSAVSMALAELEKQAGGPLFRRAGRRMIPGERGRFLAEEAGKVLSLVSRMEELLEPSGELRGVLRIGASTTIGNYLLPALLAAFREANPLVRLAMEVANTAEIAARLEAGDLDLACVEGPVRSANLKVTDWRGDRLAVIAAPGHPWTKEPPSPSDLAAAPWIMREKGSGTREVFEAAMRAASIAPNVLMELGHTEAIKKAVEANLGVGCLSILAVQRELEAGTLAEVSTPLDLQRSLTILTDAREAPGRIAAACTKALEMERGG
jgi:DNA-binding transcriptional LysR family regulator